MHGRRVGAPATQSGHERSKPAPDWTAYSSFSRSVLRRRKSGSLRVLVQVLAVGSRSTSRAPKIASGEALLATWDAGWPRVIIMLGNQKYASSDPVLSQREATVALLFENG